MKRTQHHKILSRTQFAKVTPYNCSRHRLIQTRGMRRTVAGQSRESAGIGIELCGHVPFERRWMQTIGFLCHSIELLFGNPTELLDALSSRTWKTNEVVERIKLRVGRCFDSLTYLPNGSRPYNGTTGIPSVHVVDPFEVSKC